MGVEMQAIVGQAATDQEAREKIMGLIAQSFHVTAITAVPQKKRTSIFATYVDEVKAFFTHPNLLPSR